jgi:hypothetical protein
VLELNEVLKWLVVVFGVLSALSWLRAATVTVTPEQEAERRRKEARKRGEQPNLAGASLDGNDLSGTFRAQSTWNAVAASLAACAMLSQAANVVLT